MNRPIISLLLVLSLVLFAAACGSVGPVAPPADNVALELAPPPFTAAQIRAATDPGRTYVFRIGQGDGVTAIRTLTFTRADAAGATLRVAMTSPEGAAMGPPRYEILTWQQLVAHASWPKVATTIEDARVEVPAGAFDGKLYTVRETDEEGHESVIRAWFASSLPGAPVRFEQSSGGATQFLMELLEHHAGTAP